MKRQPLYKAKKVDSRTKTDNSQKKFGLCSMKKTCGRGPPGPPGRKGEDGVPGEAGKKGMDSVDMTAQRNFASCSMCPPGPEGLQGPDGQPGVFGPMGPHGIPGSHGQNGNVGLPGDIGLPGKRGRNGRPGPVGHNGLNGALLHSEPGLKGTRGQPGRRGERGQNGPDNSEIGEIGPNGPVGEQGYLGTIGQKGERGPSGPPGLQGSLYCHCTALLDRNGSYYTKLSHQRQPLQQLEDKHRIIYQNDVLRGLPHIRPIEGDPISFRGKNKAESQKPFVKDSAAGETKVPSIFKQEKGYISKSDLIVEDQVAASSPNEYGETEDNVEQENNVVEEEGREKNGEDEFSASEEDANSDIDSDMSTGTAPPEFEETALTTTVSDNLSATAMAIPEEITIPAAFYKSFSTKAMIRGKTRAAFGETPARSESDTDEKDVHSYETIVLLPLRSYEMIRKQKLLSLLNNDGRLKRYPTPPQNPPRISLYTYDAKDIGKRDKNKQDSKAMMKEVRTNEIVMGSLGKPEILRKGPVQYENVKNSTKGAEAKLSAKLGTGADQSNNTSDLTTIHEQAHQLGSFVKRKNVYGARDGKNKQKLTHDTRFKKISQKAFRNELQGVHDARFVHTIVSKVDGKLNKLKMVPRRSFRKQFGREEKNWEQPHAVSSYQKLQINKIALPLNRQVVKNVYERAYAIENEMQSHAGRRQEKNGKENNEAIVEEGYGLQKKHMDSLGELIERNDIDDFTEKAVLSSQDIVQQRNDDRLVDRNPHIPSPIDTKNTDQLSGDNSEVIFNTPK
ncbi:hypothetical protein KIN20_018847 [Parelaphostrongylus tenuis]|uniref:Collagen n=1 Tax=Parelaphostrongylus tenuis TaxID=148309 RepID=A0AAD5QUP1_PARTN|nr:hypothetical protein KIN20_018847 [Parelaphostrongylus tenuis]